MRKLAIGTLLALAMTVSYSRNASAVGVSAGVLVGNGFKDGYNLGFGARAGVTLPFNLYVGGTFVYHLGTTTKVGTSDVTSNLYYLGAEGGYEIGAGPLTLRPYLGLGYATAVASSSQTCVGGTCINIEGGSNSKFALWPGATAILPLGSLFVGVDARYVVVVDADDANAFSAFATAGLKF